MELGVFLGGFRQVPILPSLWAGASKHRDLCCANTWVQLLPQRTSVHIWHGETFCSRVAQQLLKHFGLCGHQSAVGVDLERGEGRCPGAESSVKQWG